MKDDTFLPESLAKQYLKNIVSQLSESFMPLTLQRRSFIVNHISPNISLGKNQDLVSHTLGNLLQNVISLTREQCIQVFADETGNTTISVHCVDPVFCDSLAEKTYQVQKEIRPLGGSIRMSIDKNHGTSLTLSLHSPSEAA